MTLDEVDDNVILVTGAVFAIIHRAPGAVDVVIPDGEWNAIEFGLDFMKSRYRVTVSYASGHGDRSAHRISADASRCPECGYTFTTVAGDPSRVPAHVCRPDATSAQHEAQPRREASASEASWRAQHLEP